MANHGSDTVSVVDLAAHTLVTTIAVGSGPIDVAVTPDGSRAYVANSFARTVSVLDTASHAVVATIPVVVWSPRSVAITSDGARVWVSGDRGITVINAASNTVVGEVPTVRFASDVAFSPDGARAYVVADGLQVVDTATFAVLADLYAGHGVVARSSAPPSPAATP